MKKVMLLILSLMVVFSITSCSTQSSDGFKTELPTFREARIKTSGQDWTVAIESYEIDGDMIFIHGSNGVDVLTSMSNCILVA